MKKLGLLATAISAAVFASSVQATGTAAQAGTINITGKVVNNTCSVTSGTATKNVKLPTVSSSQFTAEDQIVAKTQFQIGLENCLVASANNGQTVRLFFSPANVAAFNQAKGILNNTYTPSTGTAAGNVGVAILTKNSELIPVGKDIDQYTQTGDKETLVQGMMFLDYFAAYYSLSTSVTPGEVQASVTYSLAYD